MKFKIINLLFTFLLLCNCQSSQSQCQMLLSDTAEISTNQSPFEWATFTLPITVAQLINGLGNYTKFIFIRAYAK